MNSGAFTAQNGHVSTIGSADLKTKPVAQQKVSELRRSGDACIKQILDWIHVVAFLQRFPHLLFLEKRVVSPLLANPMVSKFRPLHFPNYFLNLVVTLPQQSNPNYIPLSS